MVLIDECHASGFMGKTGRGTPGLFRLFLYVTEFAEVFNVMDRIDFINNTLGKALGGANGGYTTGTSPHKGSALTVIGRREAIELLRQKSRPYLFSNTLPPAVVGAGLKMYEMLSESTERRDKLEKNTRLFRTMTSTYIYRHNVFFFFFGSTAFSFPPR